MSSLTSFPLFASLPTELRLRIWALNLPGPRLVSLHYTASNPPPNPTSSPAQLQTQRGCTSPTPIPANLHINREARYEALAAYALSFNLHHRQPRIFFNPAIDVLYFGPQNRSLDGFRNFCAATSMIVQSELGKVTRLAVHEGLFFQADKTVSAPRIADFWEYVERKFMGVVEVAVLAEDFESRECKIRRCDLVWEVQSGLDQRSSTHWKGPNWDIVAVPGFVEEGWPYDRLPEVQVAAGVEDIPQPRGMSAKAHSSGSESLVWDK